MATESPKIGYVHLERLHNWPEALSHYLEGLRDLYTPENPIDWDSFNCVQFGADAVLAMTGYDFYQPYRDAKSPAQVAKRMKAFGYYSIVDALEDQFIEKPVSYATRGDLLLVEGRLMSGRPFDRKVLGVDVETLAIAIAEPPIAWALGDYCLGTLPILEAVRCFAVGE